MASRFQSPFYDESRLKDIHNRAGLSMPDDPSSYFYELGVAKRRREEEEKRRKELEKKRKKEEEARKKKEKEKDLMDLLEEEEPEKKKEDNNFFEGIGKAASKVGDFFGDLGSDAKDLIWNDKDGDGKKIDDVFGNLLDGTKRSVSKGLNSTGFNVLDDVIEKLPGDKWKDTKFSVPFSPGISLSANDLVDSQKKTDNKAQKSLDFISEMAGYIVPGTGAYKAAKGLGMGAKSASVAQRAKEGAAAGGLFSLADVGLTEGLAPEDRNAQDHIVTTLMNVGLGAGLDAAAPVLGKIAKRIFDRGARTEQEIIDAASNEIKLLPSAERKLLNPGKPLELPEGKSLSRPRYDTSKNQPVYDEPPLLGEGSKEPSAYYAERLEEFSRLVQREQLPPGREKESLEEMWGIFARNEDVNLEEAIELATPTLDYMKKYGKKPNVSESDLRTERYNPIDQDPLSFTGRVNAKAERILGDLDINVGPNGVKVKSNPIIDSLEQPFKRTVIRSADDPIATSGSNNSATSTNGNPLGITARATDPYNSSPIAGASTFRRRVEQGRETLQNRWQQFKENHLSDLQVAKDVEEAIRGTNVHHSYNWRGQKNPGGVDAENSWYKGLRASRRAQSMAHYAVDRGIRPIVRSLEQNGISKIDFEEYALAKHADEVLRNNPDYQFPPTVTREWIDRTLQRWDGNETMTNAQQSLVNFNRQMLQRRVDAGIYTQETVDRMIRENPNYISLARDIEDFQGALGNSSNIMRSQQDIRRRRGGSDDDVLSPLDTTIRNAYVTIANAEKNSAMQRIRELARLDTENHFFREMRPNETGQGRNVVSFFENGREVRYEVDPAIYRMSRLLDQNQLSSALKGFSEANKLLRKGATQYNYKFILRSMLRDPQTALTTSRTGMNPLDLANAWLDTLFGRQLENITNGRFRSYRDIYERNGGLYSGLISMDNQSLANATKTVSRPRVGFRHLNPFHYVGKVGEAAEHVPKLAEFRSAKRKGLSDDDAMFEAVDVIDYSDAGAVSRDVNKVVTFYNAAIRGNKRLLDAFAENPARATRNAIATVSVPTALAYFSRYAPGVSDDQREKLEQLNDYERNMFWHLPIPGTEEIMVVPKAHVIGQTFANPIERTFDYLKTMNPEEFDGTMKELALSLKPPMGMAMVQPLLEVITNHKFFLDGAPVVDRESEKLDPKEQYNVYTSEVAKKAGDKTGLSPMKVDHILKGMTGGAGEQVLDVIDWISSQSGNRPEKPSPGIIENLLGSAYLRDPMRGSGTTNEIYDAKSALDNEKNAERLKIKDTLRNANPSITNDDLTDLLRDGYEYSRKDDLSLAKEMTDALGLISQEIQNIRESDRLTGREKADQIEELREKERQLNLLIKKKGLLNKIK